MTTGTKIKSAPALNRLIKARAAMAAAGVDTLLVTDAVNRYYLSGFNGSAGYLFVSAESARLAVDFRYREQALRQAPGCEVVPADGDLSAFLPGILKDLATQTLGFEAESLSHAAYGRLKSALRGAGIRLKDAAGLTAGLRLVKEPGEIALISSAVAITVAAFRHIRDIIRPGLSELELAWEVEKFMREHGSEAMPFPVIVASGPNAALPHARPGKRLIAAGEPVVVDIGAACSGYTSDMTRTFTAGRPDGRFDEVYDTVLRAQRAAAAAIRTGQSGAEVDKVARDIISAAGYGEAFGHSLGHGIGMEIHEGPHLGSRSTDIIGDGMVFTVEPGIYLGGWGGVRLEDDFVMENGRARPLSKMGEI